MNEIREVLTQILNEKLIQAVFSNTKEETIAGKVKIRPIVLKGELLFQQTLYRGTQVFHTN